MAEPTQLARFKSRPDYTPRFFSHLLSAFLPFLRDSVTGLPECHELVKSASDSSATNEFLTVRNV